jgi:hypothetical protein
MKMKELVETFQKIDPEQEIEATKNFTKNLCIITVQIPITPITKEKTNG